MKVVKISISAQINELALILTIQVTNAIKEGLSLQLATIPTQNIKEIREQTQTRRPRISTNQRGHHRYGYR